ncbi:MAG: hypothetical protein LBQ86_02920 [Holophagales bacterium]|jgi:hypothetical protein|nr:hypothetical protein [Holophagales bacterium]
MDKISLDSFGYTRFNPRDFSRLKDALNAAEEESINASEDEDAVIISADAKLKPNLDFKNMTSRELIITAMYLESTGVISAEEAGVLRSQALACGNAPKGGPASSYYDLDSPVRFNFVKQITGAIKLTRNHIPEADSPREAGPLESALEKILAMSA